MVLYACASCLLGWSGMACLASASLRARDLDARLGMAARMAIVLICMAGAICAWTLLDDVVACLSFSFACACMSALLVCDLRERILPTELVAMMLVLAVAFRLSVGSLAELLAIGAPAAIVAASLLALSRLHLRRGAPELVGSGDLRMVVPLALFAGGAGLMYGLLAGSVLMGAIAVVQLACGHAGRDTHIALAPGLAACLFAGTLLPFM